MRLMSDLKVRPPKDTRKSPHAKPACGARGSGLSRLRTDPDRRERPRREIDVWGTGPSAIAGQTTPEGNERHRLYLPEKSHSNFQ